METTQKTYETKVGLEIDTRIQMLTLLNQHLADSFDLYAQVKQAHWNVKGMDFIALHELFDDVAAAVLEYVDMIAERVTALGGEAQGTARMAAANTSLPEFPVDLSEGREFVEVVRDRVAAFTNASRTAINTSEEAGDMATADLYTEIVRELDKQLYFLEAHLR